MSYSVRKDFKFCYGHQLDNAYTALCHETIHGHNGKVEVYLRAVDSVDPLDETGMVLDFTKIKNILGDYFDSILDHSLIMPNTMEKEYLNCLKKYNKRLIIVDFNPTCENLAKMIYDNLSERLKRCTEEIRIFKIVLWESESGCATYEGDIK